MYERPSHSDLPGIIITEIPRVVYSRYKYHWLLRVEGWLDIRRSFVLRKTTFFQDGASGICWRHGEALMAVGRGRSVRDTVPKTLLAMNVIADAGSVLLRIGYRSTHCTLRRYTGFR